MKNKPYLCKVSDSLQIGKTVIRVVSFREDQVLLNIKTPDHGEIEHIDRKSRKNLENARANILAQLAPKKTPRNPLRKRGVSLEAAR